MQFAVPLCLHPSLICDISVEDLVTSTVESYVTYPSVIVQKLHSHGEPRNSSKKKRYSN